MTVGGVTIRNCLRDLLLLIVLFTTRNALGNARGTDAATAGPSLVSYISTRRFPKEGDHNVTLCTEPPLSSGPGAAAQIHEVGVSLRFPTRGHGFSLAAPSGNGTAGCFELATGVTANAGPGNLSISSSVAGTGAQAVEIEYYESVAVAFGLRPYINEAVGTLLLAPDREVVAATSATRATSAEVSMELPFATPPRTEQWSGTTSNGGNGKALLSEPEQVLTFSLDGLPASINQDVKITIVLPSGSTIVKWRRLMRAPPLPSGSAILPVQVDHSTKSLLVDGRPHSGTGFYLDGVAHAHGAYHNMTECLREIYNTSLLLTTLLFLMFRHNLSSYLNIERGRYIVKMSAPNLVNHGMVYRLSTFPPEEQLAFLDQVAAVGFRVMYDVGQQQDDCGDPKFNNTRGNETCFSDPNSSPLVKLKQSINLVKGHPALLGYYICDDCCQSDVGAAFQAQAYNLIKQADPYHAVIGASDCGDTWMFFDNALTCPNKNGTEPQFPWDVCPPPTADTTLPVIPFGSQPTTQLSLDYLMQEDYAGGLASHAGDGTWNKGPHQDGWFRHSIPFEPLCNCPESGHDGEVGLSINGYSQIWESAVIADMWDQLIFIGGDYEWTGVAASAAIRMQELRPSFRRPFGSSIPRPRISLEVLHQNEACLTQHDKTSEKLAGGPLRGAVWTKPTPGNASAVCLHVVVINTALTATYAFHATISGAALSKQMVATRMYDAGPTLNVSVDGGMMPDYIAPGATNIYVIGCEEPSEDAPDPSMEFAAPLFRAQTTDVTTPGWAAHGAVGEYSSETNDFAHMIYDPRFAVFADTSVAVQPLSHSLRFSLPSQKPQLIDFPGTQLVPLGPYGKRVAWDPEPSQRTKVGDKVVGNCVTLPGGGRYKVSLQLQASPCGTTISLMSGYWEIKHVIDREGSQDVTGTYNGVALAPSVTPCGTNWTTLEVMLQLPPANATVNGTALQLQLAAPQTERGWGASIWIGAASIVAA